MVALIARSLVVASLFQSTAREVDESARRELIDCCTMQPVDRSLCVNRCSDRGICFMDAGEYFCICDDADDDCDGVNSEGGLIGDVLSFWKKNSNSGVGENRIF